MLVDLLLLRPISSHSVLVLRVDLRALRVLRLLRLLKIARYSQAMPALLGVLYAERPRAIRRIYPPDLYGLRDCGGDAPY